MQVGVIELKEWWYLHLKVGMLWLKESEHMVNRSKYGHHIAVNLLDDRHVRHKADFDIPLFDDISAGLDQMRVRHFSSGQELEQNINLGSWWKKYCISIYDQIILLSLYLSLLFPMLELMNLVNHLHFSDFCQFVVWVVDCNLVCLSVSCFVFYWNCQKVYISWDHRHLD